MIFFYCLGKTPNNFNEIRYSLRSVYKHHPDAKVLIIGEHPNWYTGDHIYYPDHSPIPYINKWRKLKRAAQELLNCEESIIMLDDDMYLNSPYKERIYYRGLYKDKVLKHHNQFGKWDQVVKNTANFVNDDCFNYMVHSPIPFKPRLFLNLCDWYPYTVSPGVEARLLLSYYYHSFNPPVFPEVELDKDVKSSIFNPEQAEEFPFFSSHPDWEDETFFGYMQERFPNPSPWENTKTQQP